jgi:cellulose synthase/poly-beta-1,6-N-acetylglucosamine synthase-like glycosyltransferase
MLSVLVSFRNSRDGAVNLLRSMYRTLQAIGAGDVELVLIDDASDPAAQMPQLLGEFAGEVRTMTREARVTQLLFKQHQHYSRALAQGLSVCTGKHVLFVSHDMLITPDYVRTLLAVAATDRSIGLVRGTSPYVDCFPHHVIAPPPQLPIRRLEDLEAFSALVSRYFGLYFEEDQLLTGDSMLITRAALDKIGVFDPGYFGYFGDIDFGLRLQRAGFKMVCAKGAWLWHEGAGAYRSEQQKTHEEYARIHERRMKVVNEAYLRFREKWDLSLPPAYAGTAAIPFERLRRVPSPAAGEYQPPVPPDPAICEIR